MGFRIGRHVGLRVNSHGVRVGGGFGPVGGSVKLFGFGGRRRSSGSSRSYSRAPAYTHAGCGTRHRRPDTAATCAARARTARFGDPVYVTSLEKLVTSLVANQPLNRKAKRVYKKTMRDLDPVYREDVTLLLMAHERGEWQPKPRLAQTERVIHAGTKTCAPVATDQSTSVTAFTTRTRAGPS